MPKPSASNRSHLALLTTAVVTGVLCTTFSSIFINIGLPLLSHELDISASKAHWLVTIFITTSTLFLLLSATLVNKYSIRSTFIGFISLFIVASLIGGFCQSFWPLFICRAIQGAAMGVLSTIAIVAMFQAYPIEKRGQAGALFGLGIAMGPTLGPTIGGIIVEYWGWRAVFFVPLPLAFMSLALSARILPKDTVPSNKAFDKTGFILIAIAILGAMAALGYLQHSHWPLLPSLIIGSALVGVMLIFCRQQQQHEQPLIAIALFQYPAFTASAIIAFIYGMGLWGSAFFLPLYLQQAISMSAWSTGMVMLPSGLLLFLILPLGGRMADRLAPRWVVGGGLLAFGCALTLIGLGVANASFIPLAILIAISRGIGFGLMIPSLDATATRALPSEAMAEGVAIMNFLRQLGGAFSPTLIMLVLDWRISANTALADSPAANLLSGYHQTFLAIGLLFMLSIIVAGRLPGIPQPLVAVLPDK